VHARDAAGLAELPAAHAQQEAQHVRLLALPQLLNVLAFVVDFVGFVCVCVVVVMR
jgi:hypothetical protein